MTEKKTIFEEELKCPYCRKYINVKKIKTTILEATKGEYEEEVIVEKSKQKRLK